MLFPLSVQDTTPHTHNRVLQSFNTSESWICHLIASATWLHGCGWRNLFYDPDCIHTNRPSQNIKSGRREAESTEENQSAGKRLRDYFHLKLVKINGYIWHICVCAWRAGSIIQDHYSTSSCGALCQHLLVADFLIVFFSEVARVIEGLEGGGAAVCGWFSELQDKQWQERDSLLALTSYSTPRKERKKNSYCLLWKTLARVNKTNWFRFKPFHNYNLELSRHNN